MHKLAINERSLVKKQSKEVEHLHYPFILFILSKKKLWILTVGIIENIKREYIEYIASS